jgi:hypothetical protein
MLNIETLLARAGHDPDAASVADPLVICAEAAFAAQTRADARNAADYLPPGSTPFMKGLATGLALAWPSDTGDTHDS